MTATPEAVAQRRRAADAEVNRLIALNPELRLTRLDAADHLHDEAHAASYRDAAWEDGDPLLLRMAQDAAPRRAGRETPTALVNLQDPLPDP